MNRSCTSSAAALSLEADTTTVGTPRPTSSAWEGPDRATMGWPSPTSWAMDSVRVREVSFSIPLDTDTSTAPGSSRGARVRAVVRTAKDGVASTTAPQPDAQAGSEVSFSPSGRGTPLSMGFSRRSRRTADSASV